MSRQCLFCGSEIPDGTGLCPNCGSKAPASADNQTAPAAPVQENTFIPAAQTPSAPAQEPAYTAPSAPAGSDGSGEKFRQENEVKYISTDDEGKKSGAGKFLIAVIIILIIAVIGAGGYLVYKKFLSDKAPGTDYSVKTLVIDGNSENYDTKLENLANYTSLEELTITNLGNLDSDAIARAIGSSTTIRSLSLTKDGISDISFISGMTALEYLDLSESESIRWGDVVAIKDSNSDLKITFSTEWSRALAEKVNEFLSTVSSPEDCTAYMTDADNNGIPEIAIGKGTAWNYPSLYITYEGGEVISFISVYQQMFDVSGSGDGSAHFTIWKGSTYVQSEVYDETSYCTAVWNIQDGMYILKGTATENVTDESNPYLRNLGNIVLDAADSEETTAAPETTAVTAASEEETAVTEETTAAPKAASKLDLDEARAAALQQLIPGYADYQQLSYEELSVKSDAINYLSSNLFETIGTESETETESADYETTVVSATLTRNDVIAAYAPDSMIDTDGADLSAAKTLINNYKLYYVGNGTSDYAVIGEPEYIGTVEIYDWTDYEMTGKKHTEYLFGDMTTEGTFRDAAFFVNTSDNTIVKANNAMDNAMVWKDGKGVDLDKAGKFFNDTLGIEGTPMVTVDGLYTIFYENGENSGNVYADWSFSKAWFSDSTGAETDVYPEDTAGLLP